MMRPVQRGVYFVTDGEAIKIGYASHLKTRLASLQTSHHFPLFLLGSIDVPENEELALHRRFAHLRIRGEWFRPDEELCKFIDGLEAAGTLVDGERMENFRRRVRGTNRND